MSARIDPLAGAVRAEQSAMDWRATFRAEVDHLVDDVEQLVHRVDGAPACACPDPGTGLCSDSCAHCAGLPADQPCPNDPYVPAGHMPEQPGETLRGATYCKRCGLLLAADGRPDLDPDRKPCRIVAGAPTQVDPAAARELAVSLVPAAQLARELSPASSSGGAPALEHPGWRSRHDPASRRFAVVDRLAGRAALRDLLLPAGPVLNQGKEGACVGFGVADAVNVLTAIAGGSAFLADADALALYHDAQRRDDVPGEAYVGTSVLAGMVAGVAEHLFGGYLWDFGTGAIAQTLLQLRRPVVVGVPWWQAMYDTGPGGLVVGIGGGQLVGGHCLCVYGLAMRGPQGQAGPYFRWRNSWGPGYGAGGDGLIHHRDLTALLARQGEAAVPTADAQAPR